MALLSERAERDVLHAVCRRQHRRDLFPNMCRLCPEPVRVTSVGPTATPGARARRRPVVMENAAPHLVVAVRSELVTACHRAARSTAVQTTGALMYSRAATGGKGARGVDHTARRNVSALSGAPSDASPRTAQSTPTNARMCAGSASTISRPRPPSARAALKREAQAVFPFPPTHYLVRNASPFRPFLHNPRVWLRCRRTADPPFCNPPPPPNTPR